MNIPTLTLSEINQRDLRWAIAEFERRLEGITLSDASTSPQRADPVLESWRRVVKLLQLGPEPERRACPSCQGPMRVLATRCVHCWRKSATVE